MTEPVQSLLRHGFSSRVVQPWGSGANRVLLVGEAPGEVEDATGIPFNQRAPAGGVLHRLLHRGGWEAEDFRIANTVWQRPPRNWLENAPWQTEAIEAWRPALERTIEEMRPRCIVALGGIALQTLTSFSGITASRGYVLHSNYDAWVIGTYHPSFLLPRRSDEVQKGNVNNSHLTGVVIYDIAHALKIANEGFARRPMNLVTHPSLDNFLGFERRYNPDRHVLHYDIETPESGELDEEALEEKESEISYHIIRMSFCFDADNDVAVSIPWIEPYITVALRLLASHGAKGTWNGRLFDNPRLRSNGCKINGTEFDYIDLWKFLQPTLPRGLSFVAPFYDYTGEPWKALNWSQPEYYSCVDSYALSLIGTGIERDLRSTGRWQRALDHVVRVSTVLQKMSDNGLPYSLERAEKFKIELKAKQEERERELQETVPEHIRPSKQKQGYKRTPKDTTGLTLRTFRIPIAELMKDEPYLTINEQDNHCDVTRWCLVEPFLPTSPQQVLKLIKHFGHKPGRDYKTGGETTNQETLKKLIRRYWAVKKESERNAARSYKLVLECRQLSKVLGTYLYGWRPKSDGRIHATPGFWGKMYRISWRNPNIAATVADKDEEYIAAGFRECVATSEGRVLLESDWKGMESVLVGYYAGDPDFIRLARLGVHDFMGLNMLGESVDLSEPDEELRQRFKQFKRNHPKLRDDAKHTIHGVSYGMTPILQSMLYNMSVPRARELQDLFFGLFPRVKKWREQVMDQAWQEAKLTNPFGYTMPFWDVYDWNQRRYDTLHALWERKQRDPQSYFMKPQKEWLEKIDARIRAGQGIDQAVRALTWDLGDDAKSAISFLPRDTGAAMLKEVLLRLEDKYHLASRGIMLSSTHDSILTEQDEGQVDVIARIVREEMEAPVPELGGLRIHIDQKVGKAWSDEAMEEYRAPSPLQVAPATYNKDTLAIVTTA
jgi:uracil-DNA glycosylase family 4